MVPQVATYWESVVKMNNYQKRRFANKIVSSMFNTVSGKKLAILGFAYKKNTSDIRSTVAVDVCKAAVGELRAEMAHRADVHATEMGARRAQIDALAARLRDEECTHRDNVAELNERLAEHTEALAAARRQIDWMHADEARVRGERARDAQTHARLEREQRLYRLETGLEPQRGG